MLTVVPESGNFYKLVGLPSRATDWVKYSVPQEYRYHEVESNLGYWFVHSDYLLGAVEVSYKQQGTVDYSRVPITLQMDIARAKENWVYRNRQAKAAIINTPPLACAYTTLHLLPSASFSIVTSVWHTLAKETHPDKGGDPEVFRKYNEAFEFIKKEET